MLAAAGRFNEAHPWSHNAAYTPWVVQHALRVRARGGRTALDVGCGTGDLLVHLARTLGTATGVEVDPTTADRARDRVRRTPGTRVLTGSVADLDLPPADLVTCVAVLHHLDPEQAWSRLRSLVRPGGRLLVVGLAARSPGDAPWEAASLLLNPLVGLARHPRPVHQAPARMTAPTAGVDQSVEQITTCARAALPGIRLHRGPFWRWTASWTAPD